MYYKVPKKKTEEITLSVSSAQKRAAIECLKAINTTFSLDILANLERGEHGSIIKPNPNDYSLPNEYLNDAQAYAVIGKNKLFCDENLLVPELVDGFFQQEKRNSLINSKFSKLRFDPLLEQVRNNVLRIIGDSPTPSRLYGELHLVDNVRFGPGSSYFAQGISVNPMDKIRNGRVALTSGAAHSWDCYTCKTPFSNKEKVTVEQDFFDFVPKNFKSLRTISVGNDGNTLIQLCHGKALRRKLKRFYDLDMQHELHKKVVKDSSIHKSYATVDIKNASNSVCKNVVKALLPPIWYDLLNKSRHHKTQIGNYVHDLELFSSMGNGFTFELETIIFLAIAMTLPNSNILTEKFGDISVFGDDIICKNEDYDLLVTRLNHFGFEVNKDKSFFGESWFRESCGADYFAGVNVTPVYLRGELDIHNLQTFYVLANKIRQMSLLLTGSEPWKSRFARAYSIAVKAIPEAFRINGPASLEFDGVDLSHGWLHTTVRRDRHLLLTSQLCFLPTQKSKSLYETNKDGTIKAQLYSDDDILTYALLGNPSSGSAIRRRITGGRVRKVHIYT